MTANPLRTCTNRSWAGKLHLDQVKGQKMGKKQEKTVKGVVGQAVDDTDPQIEKEEETGRGFTPVQIPRLKLSEECDETIRRITGFSWSQICEVRPNEQSMKLSAVSRTNIVKRINGRFLAPKRDTSENIGTKYVTFSEWKEQLARCFAAEGYTDAVLRMPAEEHLKLISAARIAAIVSEGHSDEIEKVMQESGVVTELSWQQVTEMIQDLDQSTEDQREGEEDTTREIPQMPEQMSIDLIKVLKLYKRSGDGWKMRREFEQFRADLTQCARDLFIVSIDEANKTALAVLSTVQTTEPLDNGFHVMVELEKVMQPQIISTKITEAVQHLIDHNVSFETDQDIVQHCDRMISWVNVLKIESTESSHIFHIALSIHATLWNIPDRDYAEFVKTWTERVGAPNMQHPLRRVHGASGEAMEMDLFGDEAWKILTGFFRELRDRANHVIRTTAATQSRRPSIQPTSINRVTTQNRGPRPVKMFEVEYLECPHCGYSTLTHYPLYCTDNPGRAEPKKGGDGEWTTETHIRGMESIKLIQPPPGQRSVKQSSKPAVKKTGRRSKTESTTPKMRRPKGGSEKPKWQRAEKDRKESANVRGEMMVLKKHDNGIFRVGQSTSQIDSDLPGPVILDTGCVTAVFTLQWRKYLHNVRKTDCVFSCARPDSTVEAVCMGDIKLNVRDDPGNPKSTRILNLQNVYIADIGVSLVGSAYLHGESQRKIGCWLMPKGGYLKFFDNGMKVPLEIIPNSKMHAISIVSAYLPTKITESNNEHESYQLPGFGVVQYGLENQSTCRDSESNKSLQQSAKGNSPHPVEAQTSVSHGGMVSDQHGVPPRFVTHDKYFQNSQTNPFCIPVAGAIQPMVNQYQHYAVPGVQYTPNGQMHTPMMYQPQMPNFGYYPAQAQYIMPDIAHMQSTTVPADINVALRSGTKYAGPRMPQNDVPTSTMSQVETDDTGNNENQESVYMGVQTDTIDEVNPNVDGDISKPEAGESEQPKGSTVVDADTQTETINDSSQSGARRTLQAYVDSIESGEIDNTIKKDIQATRILLYHRIYGHLSFDALKRMMPGLFKSIPTHVFSCQACDSVKIKKHPVKKGSHLPEAYRFCERLHMDLAGPFPPSTEGYRYFAVIVDQFTRLINVHLLKDKTPKSVADCLAASISGLHHVYTQLSDERRKEIPSPFQGKDTLPVVVVRTDSDQANFDSEAFRSWTAKVAIVTEFSSPYQSNRNGFAEAAVKRVSHLANVLRKAALDYDGSSRDEHVVSLYDIRYWDLAVSHATHLLNRLPMSVLKSKSPFEFFHGHPPDLKQLADYGQRVTVKINTQVNKLQDKAISARFVGWSVAKHCAKIITDAGRVREVTSWKPSGMIYGAMGGRVQSLPTPKYSLFDQPTQQDEAYVDRENDKCPQYEINNAMFAMSNFGVIQRKPPQTIRQALAKNCSERDEWLQASERELLSLRMADTWVSIDRTQVKRSDIVIDAGFVYNYKMAASGITYKARLVARGNQQDKSTMEEKIRDAAPTLSAHTLRTVLAQVAGRTGLMLSQFDIGSAFTSANLRTRNVVIRMPTNSYAQQLFDGHEKRSDDGHIYTRLNKALYGLRSAAKSFYDHLSDILQRFDMKRSLQDPCLFSLPTSDRDDFLFVAIHVDDGLVISSSKERVDRLYTHMRASGLTVKSRDIEKGEEVPFLSVAIRLGAANEISLNQRQCAETLLRKHGLWDVKSVHTPLPEKCQVKSDVHMESGRLSTDEHGKYRSMLGSLNYLATWTRPDLAFATSQLARVLHEPCDHHMDFLRRTLKYLRTTIDKGIIYGQRTRDCNDYSLEVLSDADEAQCPVTRRSNGGHVIYVRGSPVLWHSHIMHNICTSSTHAESYAAFEAYVNGSITKDLLEFISIGEPTPEKLLMRVDCQPAIKMLSGITLSTLAKWISQRVASLRQAIHEERVKIDYISTKENTADIFTKSLPRNLFEIHRDNLVSDVRNVD